MHALVVRFRPCTVHTPRVSISPKCDQIMAIDNGLLFARSIKYEKKHRHSPLHYYHRFKQIIISHLHRLLLYLRILCFWPSFSHQTVVHECLRTSVQHPIEMNLFEKLLPSPSFPADSNKLRWHYAIPLRCNRPNQPSFLCLKWNANNKIISWI